MKFSRHRITSKLMRPFIADNNGVVRYGMLNSLPTELLLEICEFLKPLDRRCFSLINHRMYSLYQAYYSRLPSHTGVEKLSILLRIERDLTEYFACYVCNRLHWFDGSESFGLSGLAKNKTSTLPCDYKRYDPKHEINGDVTMSMRTHNRFAHSESRLTHLQLRLVMKRFYYGTRHGISTDSLSYTQIRSYLHPIQPTEFPNQRIEVTDPKYPKVPTLFSIEAQICPDPPGLYIRTQDILVYKTWEDSKIKPSYNPMEYYQTCYHGMLSSKRWHLEELKEGKREYLYYQCSRCVVKSKIEIIENFDSQVALVMTRWFNLGAGLDHNDPLWQVQAYGPTNRPREVENSQNLKCPRSSFEKQAPESFHKLRDRNLSYLKGERYKKGEPFVIHEGSYLWYIPYKEPSKELKKSGKGRLRPIWRKLCRRARRRKAKIHNAKRTASRKVRSMRRNLHDRLTYLM